MLSRIVRMQSQSPSLFKSMTKTPLIFRFSTKIEVPCVDLTEFLQSGHSPQKCEEVASAFINYGVLLVKDPRVNPNYNYEFLDLMEKYFQKRSQQFYKSGSADDIFPELGYQTGATPELIEMARTHSSFIQSLSSENRPFTPQPPPADQKWRYFWRMGERPQGDRTLDPPKTIPADFEEFERVMDQWGKCMIDAVNTVSEMSALGMGLEKSRFRDLLQGGAHLLAPTGSDLQRYGVGTVFAGFHYDFNFLTIHGKSRYPGLFAWTRNGQKFTVSVPANHLLLQSGKQFQYLTGGKVTCGFHEVIYTEEVKRVKEQREKEGGINWRVSSTLFGHVRHDVVLQPLKEFQNKVTKGFYQQRFCKGIEGLMFYLIRNHCRNTSL